MSDTQQIAVALPSRAANATPRGYGHGQVDGFAEVDSCEPCRFMCRPSGAGKSTYADLLEMQGMVRLSTDVELFARGVTAVPPPDEVRAEIHVELKQRLLALVAEGRDVVPQTIYLYRQGRDLGAAA